MTLRLRTVTDPIPASVQDDALLPVYSLLARLKQGAPVCEDSYQAGCCLLIMGAHLSQVAGDHVAAMTQKTATQAWLDAGQRKLRAKDPNLKLSARQRQQVIAGLGTWPRVLPKVGMAAIVEAAESWKHYERAAKAEGPALGFVERLVAR